MAFLQISVLPFSLSHIWHIRNKSTLEYKRLNIDIPMLVTNTAEHYFLTNNSKKQTSNTPLYIKWHPPYAPCYKLNIDGSASPILHNYGIGGVFRDSQGHWIMGFAGKLHQTSSAHIELLVAPSRSSRNQSPEEPITKTKHSLY